MESIPGDVIRHIASHGSDVACVMARLCKRFYFYLRVLIPTIYRHLPISKREITAYGIHLLHNTIISSNIHATASLSTRIRNVYLSLFELKQNRNEGKLFVIVTKYILRGTFYSIRRRRKTFPIPLTEKAIKWLHNAVERVITEHEPQSCMPYDIEAQKWIYGNRISPMRLNPHYAITNTISNLMNVTTLPHGNLGVLPLSLKEYLMRCGEGIVILLGVNRRLVSHINCIIINCMQHKTYLRLAARIRIKYKINTSVVAPLLGMNAIEALQAKDFIFQLYVIRMYVEEALKEKYDVPVEITP